MGKFLFCSINLCKTNSFIAINLGGPSEDNYYNNQFMYGNENLSATASNVMMNMGLQQNALSSLNIIVNNKT